MSINCRERIVQKITISNSRNIFYFNYVELKKILPCYFSCDDIARGLEKIEIDNDHSFRRPYYVNTWLQSRELSRPLPLGARTLAINRALNVTQGDRDTSIAIKQAFN